MFEELGDHVVAALEVAAMVEPLGLRQRHLAVVAQRQDVAAQVEFESNV